MIVQRDIWLATRYVVEVRANGLSYLGYSYNNRGKSLGFDGAMAKLLIYRASDEAGTWIGEWTAHKEDVEIDLTPEED